LGDLDVNVIILKLIIQGWDMRMCKIHVVQNAVHYWARVKTNELSVAVRYEEFIALLKLLSNYSAL
jgi:hypothetical protein